ncbi:MAG: hypothetical protein J6E46_00555 [Faecalicoccus sp.]|nr:hypothetical protein [Faecalicoccus sp.]
MNGKDKCRILKQIRKEIADANDIPFITENCEYQGECTGTCPKCEADLRYLEMQLDKRKRKGLSIMVAGMSLLAGVSMTGCEKIESILPGHKEEVDPGDIMGMETYNPDDEFVEEGIVEENDA